jgi:negative regulator of replication initiation
MIRCKVNDNSKRQNQKSETQKSKFKKVKEEIKNLSNLMSSHIFASQMKIINTHIHHHHLLQR